MPRALVILLSAFVLGGCGLGNGDVEWSDSRSSGRIVGFIDDSLVIVSDNRSWFQDLGGFIEDHGERSGVGHTGLVVYDYRVQKDGPVWRDSLDNDDEEDYSYASGQLSDSVIWGGDVKRSVSFWKVGGKPKKHSLSVKKKGCTESFGVSRLRPWRDGSVFAQGPLTASGDSCQYAVLDTTSWTLTYQRLSGDLVWIQACDDVRAFGENVFCVRMNDSLSGVDLFVDGSLDDSIDVTDKSNFSSLFKYYPVEFMGKMLYFGNNINSVDIDKREIVLFPNIKTANSTTYIDEDGNSVFY